jgi:hypothetical protein
MPKYEIALVYDSPSFGQVSVEADTWEEAVASLSYDDWDDNCHNFERSDDIWERRVIHVYNQDNDIVAEDLSFDCTSVCGSTVARRIGHTLNTCEMSDDAKTSLAAIIDEIDTMHQDPIFKKREKVMRYVVETRMGNVWEDVWSEDGEPMTFDSEEAAEAEIEDTLDTLQEAYELGDMSSPMTRDEFRIVAL